MKVPIPGNTYPVKEQLKSLGAKWDGDNKTWIIEAAKLPQAQAIVQAAPVQTPGVCSKCGKSCKAPYTLCLACKPAYRPTQCKQCGARPGPRGWPKIYRNGICSDCYQDDREEREMGY